MTKKFADLTKGLAWYKGELDTPMHTMKMLKQ